MSELKIPAAIVVAIVLQTIAGVWWVSSQMHKLYQLEDQVKENTGWIDQLYADTEDLIKFATFTENKWADSYEADGYQRQWGTKQVETE
tara:strand:- start:1165 stop:1431 length:267 start_codon:yes stop_codon:yes gene_type:complete